MFFDTDLSLSSSFVEKLLVLRIRMVRSGSTDWNTREELAKDSNGLKLATVAAPAVIVPINLRRENRALAIRVDLSAPNLQKTSRVRTAHPLRAGHPE
jgi:hypothetical protein